MISEGKYRIILFEKCFDFGNGDLIIINCLNCDLPEFGIKGFKRDHKSNPVNPLITQIPIQTFFDFGFFDSQPTIQDQGSTIFDFRSGYCLLISELGIWNLLKSR